MGRDDLASRRFFLVCFRLISDPPRRCTSLDAFKSSNIIRRGSTPLAVYLLVCIWSPRVPTNRLLHAPRVRLRGCKGARSLLNCRMGSSPRRSIQLCNGRHPSSSAKEDDACCSKFSSSFFATVRQGPQLPGNSRRSSLSRAS